MAKLSRIGKLSPITPEDVKSQSGYTISSYNKPRQMKGLTLERVAEICKQINPNRWKLKKAIQIVNQTEK